MPPRQGIVTIEKLAVNAVMAGCRPEYFPVVVAATEAMLEERFNLYAVQSTTHPCAPLLILNGPIASEIGVNSRYNAFGQGWRANATIGRAIRLILLNVGGGAPGVLDRATQGQPSKYSYCVAENELENPWSPLHVERGFDRATSTVTVCGAENPHNLNDHISNASPGILTMIASSMAVDGLEQRLPLRRTHPRARSGARGDPGARRSVEGRRPPLLVAARANPARAVGERRHVRDDVRSRRDAFSAEPALPMFRKPDDLMIIVVGAAGRHSCWMPTFGAMTQSVTRAITLADGTPLKAVGDLQPTPR